MPPLMTHQYPVVASVDPAIKDAFQSFGTVKPSPTQCISPFLIGACALDDVQLIAEGMALLAGARLDSADPAVSLEETEGVVEVLGAYTGEVAAAVGFAAPNLIRDASAALANIARMSEAYTKAVGGSGGMELYLGWLQATEDEHTVAPICELLSEVIWDTDHLEKFLELGGLPMIKTVLQTEGTSPRRLENALQIIVTMSQSDNEEARKQFVSAGLIELLVSVMGGHKTQNSAVVHSRAGHALHHLLSHDTKGDHRKAMVKAKIVDTLLACLMPRVTTPQSAETVGGLMTELIYSAPEKDSVAASLLGGLPRLLFVFQEYPTRAPTLTVFMQVVASLCATKEAKEAVVDAELVEAVVQAMLEHPDAVRLQEQACRTLCEVSRGEDNENVKAYMADVLEDSFYHGFNLIELILKAIKDYVDDLNFVEAACSASWSVAYKNAKMKTKAAEAGVFDILKKVIDYHKNEPEVLPHCFGAISNLCANHEPNQKTAATSGVIKECMECLEMYQEHPMMCVTILNTLKSITVNQDDNLDKLEDQSCSTMQDEEGEPLGSTAMIQQITEMFGGTKDETDKKIVKLTEFLDKMIVDRHELIEAKKKKADAGKIPMCEFLEEQDHALKALNDDEKSKVVKKGMLMAQHKGDKFPNLNLCVLTNHEIVFYDDPEVSKTLTPLFTYQIPLFQTLTDEAFPMEFETMNKEVASIEAFTETEADGWHQALMEIQPERNTAVQVVDSNHKKKLPRTIVWQHDVFYIYMGKPGKMIVRRAFMCEGLTNLGVRGKEFTLTEAAHGDQWIFECKDDEEALDWMEFIQTKLSEKLEKIAEKARQAGTKADAKEAASAAALAAKEKKQAEECWFEEESDRRLLLLMAGDEAQEEGDVMDEFEIMEKKALVESQQRQRDATLRSQMEEKLREKEEQKSAAKKDKKDLRAYIDALKKELEAADTELAELREANGPLHKELDTVKKERMDAEMDYVEMKKEFNTLLGGKLGAVLEGFDFEAMERNKAEAMIGMEIEEEQAKQQALDDAAMAGGYEGRNALASLRDQHL